MPTRIEVKNKVNAQAQVLDIFSVEDLVKGWEKKTGKTFAQLTGEGARAGANYAAAIIDTRTALRLITDLGVKGEVVLKSVQNKQYVIFKGYAGTRSIFNATRYLATNPKVVDMAISRIGVNASILSGARLTIFLVVPLNVINHILSDQRSLAKLIGTTATDLVKVGAASASAIAALVATAAASVTTLAAGPLIVAIGVGLLAGYALDKLDKQFGVTDLLISAIEKAHDTTIGEFNRQLNQVERRLKWQIQNGLPVGQGIFY